MAVQAMYTNVVLRVDGTLSGEFVVMAAGGGGGGVTD